jgi:hypothetical protein
MSLPVRLMFGDNKFTIPVQAEEITMAVHRKLHAFPIPFDGSQRIGIDTNMASMQMNMSLILQDDTVALPRGSGQPLVNMLNFAKFKTGVTADSFRSIGSIEKVIRLPVIAFSQSLVYATLTDFNQSGIKLVMDGTTTSNLAGGSGNPSVRSGHNLIENGQVIIDVPVGGIHTVSNPATTIALAVKQALELTTNITNLSTGVDNAGGKRVVDVFNVTVSPDNDTVLIVEQKYIDRTQEHSFSVFVYPSEVVTTTVVVGSGLTFSGTTNSWKLVKKGELLTSTFQLSKNLPPTGIVGNLMSAGDKAQTLLGLLANAKTSTDLLRGIQIPYDSLIQSNAVTPEVRNFFTTYGRTTSPDDKSSDGNTLPASKPMIAPSKTSKDGQSVLDDSEQEESIPDMLLGAVDDVLDLAFSAFGLDNLYDGLKDIGAATIDALKGEVSSQSRANGIYVLPENFHLRKEAGKNYYVADLDLIMVHKVAGV